MFEFFEVPSQMIGAVGPVAQGTDFDWLRQDIKPGLINLNLIIDEEVFFSVFGKQNTNFNQQLLSFDQLAKPVAPSLRRLQGRPWPAAGRGILADPARGDRDQRLRRAALPTR